MADFRQLALDFVLGDEEPKLTGIAQLAAQELQNSPANSNPVARWVESVQPWMPGSNDVAADSQDSPDWTARAKALEFLARTLDFIKRDTLKPSQVNLLVSFFGAMFDIDHKAGIMASAEALSSIIAMRSFHPRSGNDIIEKICMLKDDFPRQIAKTRLSVYQLLQSLITNPEVAKDLHRRHGEASTFMHDLLQLCQNERDPDCLMAWFGTLKYFLVEYTATQEILEEVYAAFKAYFPITLPRISESGITPEELKLQLRGCFSANYRLAALALPFLIGKLDQGDGVTVNVKVDVLRTIKTCIENYEQTEQSASPYVSRIWGSLKYEVRNGEIEDTIWATLEVLKAVTTKLRGDELRDYALTVTRDCVNDLSSATYTAPAGRLLISVLSANTSAFVLMVAPVVTHVKENLRHPKSPSHSQDLLKILRVILETRILLVESGVAEQDRADFAAVDGIFKSLYDDVYRAQIEIRRKAEASIEEIKIATEAVQGAGALVCQQQVATQDQAQANTADSGRLLSDHTCSQICESLLAIALQSCDGNNRRVDLDELVNESTIALQRTTRVFEPGFKLFVDRSMDLVRSKSVEQSPDSIATIKALTSLVAFVGCSELPNPQSEGMRRFLSIFSGLQEELTRAMEGGLSPQVWSGLAAGIQSTVRYFNDACLQHKPDRNLEFEANKPVSSIVDFYVSTSQYSVLKSISQIRNDFLLVSIFNTARLYRQAIAVDVQQDGRKSLQLSNAFTGVDESSEYQYLHLIADLGRYVIHELSEPQQLSLQVNDLFGDLFQGVILTSRTFDASNSEPDSWGWLINGRVNVLFLGVLEALRPAVVEKLFANGIGQSLLLNGSSVTQKEASSVTRPVTSSILTILANKYKIETLESLIPRIEQQLTGALNQAKSASNIGDAEAGLNQVSHIYAIIAGMLRRYSGKQAQGILQLLLEAPVHAGVGGTLARRMEMIVAPQMALSKDYYAIIKPLWMQKTYIELVKPMLLSATGGSETAQEAVLRTNFSIGVLLMVKHINFSIYEEDAEKILRISISVAQNAGNDTDKIAALDVLKTILIEASDKAESHIRSLINICSGTFSSRNSSTDDSGEPELRAGCGRLALEILGGLPKLFESRHLVQHASQVERDLSIACGHSVRDLRRSARSARVAWSGVN